MDIPQQDLTLEEEKEEELSFKWTLVYYDRDDDCLGVAYYETEEELLADCMTEDGEVMLEDYLAFKGELSPLKLRKTLSLVSEECDEEDDDEEDGPTSRDIEERLRGDEPKEYVY
jgi:hypothetical protein